MKRRNFLKGAAVTSAGMFLFPTETKPINFIRKDEESLSLHKIMTCNIRVALPQDDEKGLGWNDRKNLVARVIENHKPDIICLQEVIKVQMDDMRNFFPKFSSFGFEGPEMDPIPEGYHWIAKNPIMYCRRRYELTGGGTYWLSENPLEGGSKSWGTARARNVNWIRLKEKLTGKEFRIINTHLDHISQEAREVQMEMILKEASQYLKNFPQILSGDFNTNAANRVLTITKKNGWMDSYKAIHGSSDPGFTYHAFKGHRYTGKTEGNQDNSRIDFILTRGNITAKDAEVIRDSDGDFYPSDHFFVSAELEI